MKAALTLVITAFLIALFWRVEVELRDWHGLTWVGYFHFAVPAGGGIFLGWVWWVTRTLPVSGRVLAWVAGWGLGAIFILERLVPAYFSAWNLLGINMLITALFDPTGMAEETLQFFSATLYSTAFWGIWTFPILLLYAGFRYLFPFPKKLWLIGGSLWVFSWSFGLILITILPERGSDNLMHSLKTGWMIPFCVIATGLPLVNLADQRTE